MSALAEAIALSLPEPELSGELQGMGKPGLIKEQAPLVQVEEVQTTDTAAERLRERQVVTDEKAGKGEKATDARFQPPEAESALDSSSDPARAAPPTAATGQDLEGGILGRQLNHQDIGIMATTASTEPVVSQIQAPIADTGQGNEVDGDADVCVSIT